MTSNEVAMELEEDVDDPDPVGPDPEKEKTPPPVSNSKPQTSSDAPLQADVDNTDADKKDANSRSPKRPADIEIINLEEEDDVPTPFNKRRIGDCLIVEDVIDLEDSSKGTKCVNLLCKSNKVLRKCPAFCLSYFRVMSKSTKHEICESCYNEALTHYDFTVQILKNKEPLFEQDLPARDELTCISDSDEEDGEENMTEDSVTFLVDNLEDTFKDLYVKYDVKAQVDRSIDIMTKKGETLKESVEEVDTMYKSIQNRLDDLRKEFYGCFKTKYKHEVPIEFNDDPATSRYTNVRIMNTNQNRTFIQNNQQSKAIHSLLTQKKTPGPSMMSSKSSINVSVPSKQMSPMYSANYIPQALSGAPERRSSRNIGKSISYAEMDNAPSPSSPSIEAGKLIDNSQDLEVMAVSDTPPPVLPPKGALQRPAPQEGEDVFCGKMHTLTSWSRGTILEIFPPGSMINDKTMTRVTYRLRMENKQKLVTHRIANGQELAYMKPSSVQLDVGTRVIALFKDGGNNTKKDSMTYFPGIVAEPMMHSNSYRYLIFFDDGYAQYVSHEHCHVIVESSEKVWEDVHNDSRQFIRKYLEAYPDRPMVKLKQGQVVRTEWNGKWWVATVLRVEGSLVQMYFDGDTRSEWIYRGSTRLNPMFKEAMAANNRLENRRVFGKANTPQKNMPYVEYTRGENNSNRPISQLVTHNLSASSCGLLTNQIVLQQQQPLRSVAKKSTATAQKAPPSTQPSAPIVAPFLPPQNNPPASRVVFFKPRSISRPREYEEHICSSKCNSLYTYPLNKLNGYNPLAKPFLCGWNRKIQKCKSRKIVKYKAPCGRTVRNMEELHRYLMQTESDLTVDLFDFDHWVQCLAEFILDEYNHFEKDITHGLEKVPISLINYVNNEKNTNFEYSTQRVPMTNVNLNLDPEFLVGCNCEDDCADKSKCSCWQLTIDGQRSVMKDVNVNEVGYTYKRLLEQVNTGIYECNSRCKCKHTCLNRVAQHPLQLKLQVFQTTNRGWGIRCLNDVPQGTFICVYAGSLLTDQMANEGGVRYGDEYLAELDYIEVVEKLKEDYEEEAYTSDQDESKSDSMKSDKDDDEDDDDEEEDEELSKSKSKIDAYGRDDQDFHYYMQNSPDHRESTITTRRQKKAFEALEKAMLRSSLTESKKDVKDEAATKKKIDAKKETDAKKEIDAKKEEKVTEEKMDVDKKPKFEGKNHGDDIDTVTISDDEDVVREPSSFNPKESMEDDEKTKKYLSVRELYGDNETMYIMDAKSSGNIGRFLNHSCTPNVFVQNVFVDTHDLRFPWVAFFALTYIRAGTELTWNYNYDVGSVPGKIMYCHCGSLECRGRLL